MTEVLIGQKIGGAPILVDVLSQTVYKTPIYYVLKHFSKYVLPGSYRIGFENDTDLLVTAFKNTDNSIVVIVLMKTKILQNLN